MAADTSNPGMDVSTEDMEEEDQPAQAQPKATGPATSALANTLKGSPSYLKKYEDMVNDPQYARQAPPETQQSLRQAISDAKDLYNQKTNTNDWMEVAQTLSRAVAQFGAAGAGLSSHSKYGQNNAGLDFGPGIDYAARNQRAANEYKQDVGSAQSDADESRQRYLDQIQGQKQEFANKAGFYKEAIGTLGSQERAGQEADIANKGLQYQERKADTRAQQVQAAQAARDTRKDQAEDFKDTQNEIASLRKRQEEANAAIPLIEQELKSGTKDANKIIANHSKELGAIKPELDAAIKHNTTPGRIYGTNTDNQGVIDELNKSIPQLYESKITNLKQAFEQRNKDRRNGTSPQQGTGPTDNTSTAPQPNASSTAPMVRMKAPNGQIGSIPADKVGDAMKNGFTRAE